MAIPIIECIPNFSEARRPEVVDAIVAVIAAVPEVSLLDRSSDLDHNRTVLTFAGAPSAVEEAAYQAIKKAAELIDMNQHSGKHPRLGATDVVPFVPISDTTMEECVAIAKHLGERVGTELNIPVYLYEFAATRSDRTNLENIRRGQYEELKIEIESNPDRKPDYGPSKLDSAGATVIGARDPLIAFNVYLTSDDVNIAKKIAGAVRQSSGGLKNVKGLGLLVDGRAQVSMNLTNYKETPVARVFDMIYREAARYGVTIHHSEVVGLIPLEALVDIATWYLQLDKFRPDHVLETRLYSMQTSSAQPPSFLDKLADGSPAPGGGSAAAYVGAMGAGLVAMVARLTLGRKKYAEVESQMQDILEQAERLRADLTKAVKDDAAAFEAVMTANKLPKETSEQKAARSEAIVQTTLQAARVPLQVAKMAVTIIALAGQAVKLGNLNAISDAASAAALARAALSAAGYNVRINISSLENKKIGKPLLSELQVLETFALELEAEIPHAMDDRCGISLE